MFNLFESSSDRFISPQLAVATKARDMFRKVRKATITEAISPDEMQSISEEISWLFAQALLVVAHQEQDLHPEDLPAANTAVLKFENYIEQLESYPEFKVEPLTTSQNKMNDDSVSLIWRAFHKTLNDVIENTTLSQTVYTLLSTGATYLAVTAYRKKIPVQYAAVSDGKRDRAYLAKIPENSDSIVIIDDMANVQVQTVYSTLRNKGFKNQILISEFTGFVR